MLAAVVLAGCASEARPGDLVPATPASQRSTQRAGTITARGDYAPDQHGPYVLRGRYVVRFVQRGAGVDFRREVPFTAHLEHAQAVGPGRVIRLFQRAARTGATTIEADGRFELVVDFGDSPYEIVISPAARR
jgi:hypothetical protein